MIATLRLRKIKFFDDDEAQGLVVHIHIDCDSCGEQDLVFAGHHATAIYQALGRLITTEPTLTDGGQIEFVYDRHVHRHLHPERN